MTTDLLTLFQPKDCVGTAWTFPLQIDGNSLLEAWVFVAGKADPPHFSPGAVTTEDEGKRLIKNLQGLIQQRGGILIQSRAHNEVVKTQMIQVKTPQYTPPRQLLRLSPASRPHFEKITGSEDLEIGEHFVIPVSAEAEDRLRVLCKELNGLPTDMESSILNLIRRPSLEWRMDRIERTLSLPPANWADQQRERAKRGDFLDKLHRAVMWRIPIGPVIAALLLLTSTVAAYDKYFAHEEQATDARKTDEKTDSNIQASSTAKTVSPVADAQVKDAASDSLEESLEDLYTALGASRNDDIQKLYTTHFMNQSANSQTLGWGMAKLQALQLGILTTNDSLLGSPQNLTGVKNVYNQKGIAALKDHEDSRNLLAWASCRAFGRPELPKTEKDPNPVPFDEKGDCEDIKPEDAEPGLESLINWVKEHS